MGLSSITLRGSITAIDNSISNLTGNSISLLNSGDYGNISVALGLENTDIPAKWELSCDCKK